MKFLVLGANFNNKGAQAMLFVTISELKTRFPGCEILFLSSDKKQDGYNLRFLYDYNSWEFAKGGANAIRALLRVPYYKIKGKQTSYRSLFDFLKQLKSVDAFIDISGYALSSQRGYIRSRNYLDQIRIAKRFNKPYFIMPQSIGPFEYGKFKKKMDKKLKKYLSYPVIIFPREREGYELLKEKYGLTNIRLSNDLVLQNRKVNTDLVFANKYEKCFITLPNKELVAIIPNIRNFEFASKEQVLNIYSKVIKKLRSLNKTVYLLRHSDEDFEVCNLIYSTLEDKTGVIVLNEDLDCLQFGDVISQFEFVIASRFHSIVHSLKSGVPVISLGWAIKYENLLNQFGLGRFVFDVRSDLDIEKLLSAIDDMNLNWKKERNKILILLERYQKENCFDIVSEYFTDAENKSHNCEINDMGISLMKFKIIIKNQLQKIGLHKNATTKKMFNYLARYNKYAFSDIKCNDVAQYEAVITRWYHTIEKGLSYNDYRPGFGRENIEKLLNLMEEYSTRYDVSAFFYETALSCLHQYVEMNEDYGHYDEALKKRIEALPGDCNDCGGFVCVERESVTHVKYHSFGDFLKSRHSIRAFSDESVDLEKLKKAISISQFTPSACNRQGWRTIIISSKDKITEVLSNQNGNRGFGQEIDKLLLIVCDIRYFNKNREFFQPFVDGGMYAENVINALHDVGLGSIPLSASLTNEQELAIRNIMKLQDYEVLILFIGVGNYPVMCKTAKSQRKPKIDIEVI